MSDDETPKWEQVKKLLDDPNVQREQKRDIVDAYKNQDHLLDGDESDEFEPYKDKYHYTGWTPPWEKDDLQTAVDKAKASADKGSEKDRKHDEAVKDGKNTLEKSKQSAKDGAHGSAGAGKSDELLDAGKPGLRFFRNFVPLYQKIVSDYGDRSKVLGVDKIEERYQEQRGIDFGKFGTGIEDLNNIEKTLRGTQEDMASKLGGVWQNWTGSASDASQQFFSGKFSPTANDRVITPVSDAASMMQDTCRGVADLCRSKAEAVLKLDEMGEQIAEKSVQDWDTTIQVANHTEDEALIYEACSIWGVELGCNDGLNDDVKQKIYRQCSKMVRETFAKTVEDQCQNFTKLCDDTKKKVDEAWQKLNEALGKTEENPFARPGPSDDGKQQDKPQPQEPAQTGKQGVDGGGGGGGSTGGGGSGTGGGGTGGGGGGTPNIPGMPDGPGGGPGGGPGTPGTPGGPGGPGMPGGPGDPGGPGGPGEPGGPGDPGGPGEPGGPGGPELDTKEKVTLGEGDGKVTVAEPNDRGMTEVTVMGEDGQPKTYQVALGPEGGGPGGPLGPGMPQGPGVPGQPGTPGGPGGPGMPGGPGVPGTPGSQMPGGPGPDGSGGHEVIRPGPDGKAVIHEGDRTVTLERGPDGSMRVEVDNGTGQPPIQQSIEFGDEPRQPGGPGPGMPPGPGPTTVSGAPTDGPGIPGQGMPATPGPPQSASAVAGAPATPSMPGGDQPVSAGPADTGPAPAATTQQSAGFTSVGSLGDGMRDSFASTAGQLVGNVDPGGDAGPMGQGMSGHQDSGGTAGSTGLASLQDTPSETNSQGSTEIGSMGDGGGSSSQAAAGGGMMGMGGMGAAQGGGGDQERTNSSPWRTEGQLFDDGVDPGKVRHRSVLGEQDQR